MYLLGRIGEPSRIRQLARVQIEGVEDHNASSCPTPTTVALDLKSVAFEVDLGMHGTWAAKFIHRLSLSVPDVMAKGACLIHPAEGFYSISARFRNL